VVLLTDGLATAPGDKPNEYAEAAAENLKAAGVTLFTIGLGASVDGAFLSKLATKPEQSYIAPTTATLNAIYQSITASICEEGAARIDVIPKTANFAPLR
jgi:Mg-chelatase subunit ChlD